MTEAISVDELLGVAEEERTGWEDYALDGLDWFLGQPGEFYSKHEAPHVLAEELNIDPVGGLSAPQRATGVLNHLVSDHVDPVQQVSIADGQYVGVIDYLEHDGWYSFGEYHDLAGHIDRGVCAYCVNDSDLDTQPFTRHTAPFGGAPREEFLDPVMENHIHEVHSEDEVDVEPGATLASGTTIGGNTSIHGGNQSSFAVTDFGVGTVTDGQVVGNVGGSLAGTSASISAGDIRDLTASRAQDTWYQNTRGNPIFAYVTSSTGSGDLTYQLHVNSTQTLREVARVLDVNDTSANQYQTLYAIVPDTWYIQTTGSVHEWFEQDLL